MSIADIAERLQNWVRLWQPATSRILMIDDWFPDPVIGAGAPRALQILRALSGAGAQVTHFSTLYPAATKSALLATLPGVAIARRSGSFDALAHYLQRYRSGFDVILISRPHNLRAFNAMARHPSLATARLVYDAEAIFAQRDVLRMEVIGSPMTADEAHRVVEEEVALARKAASILVVNEANAAVFRAGGHSNLHIVRHAVEKRWGSRPFEARSTLLSVGPTYSNESPNTDAVAWFVDRVLPLIRAQSDSSHCLTLVGNSTASVIAARVAGRIDFLGPQPDLTEIYDRARVFIGSTRFAAGVPLKIYEAAVHGVPAVITPLLAEQLEWRHGVEALVADSPQAFADATLRLYGDPGLWNDIRHAALDRTLQDCDGDAFRAAIQASIAHAPR